MKSSSTNFISRLKRKKEDALDYIIATYLPLVKTIATKILHSINQSAIDECVNDVFLLVWSNASQFKGDADDFKRWIGIITKSKAIDRYRQADRQFQREHTDDVLLQTSDYAYPEQEFIHKENKDAILVALSQLGELDCEIFLLKYYFELSNSDIAEQLGLTKAAVDNRLYRGKKSLSTNTSLKELLI